MNYEINDIRESKAFKGITFSGFKKIDVQKEYIKCILSSKIEPAFFWACELICAGHFKDLWNLNIYIFIKYIHIGNPKLAVYLDRRLTAFIGIVNNGYQTNELALRNNDKVRKLFAEIICILTSSKQKHPYEEIKITRNELNIELLTEKLKSPNLSYGKICFKDDPKPLFVPYNELLFSLETKNTIDGCFWISWIIEYDCFCRNKKINLNAERRLYVEGKDQQNIIWMIWDAFLYISKTKEQIVITIVNSLLNIFTKRYSFAENKRKMFILYFIVSLLTEEHNYNINIIENSEKINNTVNNVNSIYKQVKANEISPNTDYLFQNVKQSNLEKTIERLEKMESLNNTFIPRL